MIAQGGSVCVEQALGDTIISYGRGAGRQRRLVDSNLADSGSILRGTRASKVRDLWKETGFGKQAKSAGKITWRKDFLIDAGS